MCTPPSIPYYILSFIYVMVFIILICAIVTRLDDDLIKLQYNLSDRIYYNILTAAGGGLLLPYVFHQLPYNMIF